jgi:hypothetical protein
VEKNISKISAFCHIGFLIVGFLTYRLFDISVFLHLGFLFYQLFDIGFLTVGFLRSAFYLIPLGSYRNAPAKKVPTKKVPGNIGPGPKGSCQKGSLDKKVPSEWKNKKDSYKRVA